MSEGRGNPVQGFFGALLMAVGGIIAALSGLCTALFMVTSLFDGGRGGDNLFSGADMVILSLVVGGIPIAIGLGLFFLGRSLHRRAQPPANVPSGPVA